MRERGREREAKRATDRLLGQRRRTQSPQRVSSENTARAVTIVNSHKMKIYRVRSSVEREREKEKGVESSSVAKLWH